MLGDDARCWVTSISQCVDPMLLQDIFHTSFSNNNNDKIIFLKIFLKTYRPMARQKHTHYANRWL